MPVAIAIVTTVLGLLVRLAVAGPVANRQLKRARVAQRRRPLIR